MSTIVTRAGKGSPLTNNEVDSNFTNLNSDKVESITSADGSVVVSSSGTTRDLSVGIAGSTATLISQVRNQTGATLTKGTVVYISGASGNKAVVSKALATSDSTSAQTYGMVQADILNNQNGYVVVIGAVSGLDTSAFADGTQLYLSGSTAGTYTSTKPYAPTHLVYVGVVTYSHANQGTIQVKIQNGYEMDELHDVAISSPATGQILVYDATTGLWSNSSVLSSYLPLSGGTISGALTVSGQTSLGGVAGAEGLRVLNVASATNYVQITGAVTGNPIVEATGASSTLNLVLRGRGSSGGVNLGSNYNSSTFFTARGVSGVTTVNYLQATAAAASSSPSLSSQGSDTNIDLVLQPKGTGVVKAAANTVLDAANYNSYAPSLTGSGASGTWGISVTGSAGSVAWTNVTGRPTAVSSFTNDSAYITSSYSGFMLRSTSPQGDPNTNFVSSAYRFDPSVNNPTNEHYSVLTFGNGSNVVGQIAAHFVSGQLFSRGYNTSWSAWRTQLDSSNYNSYSPTLTGTGASGTWGISVSGNAATVTSITSSQVTTALGFTPYNSTNPNGYTSNTGTVTGVTGTAPIVSSGGTAPAISITAATTLAAGSMSAADKTKLDGIAASANNYSLPKATATTLGGVELFDATVQTTAANAVTTTASRTYGVQLNAADQMVVNVPWSDTNSGGTVTSVSGTGTVSGLTLTGTVTGSGSLTLGGSITGFLPTSGGTLTGNLIFANATSPNTNYIQFGDNTGWRLRVMTNVSGTPTERFSFTDNGAFNATGAITQNTYQVLHAGNYNSYAPTLTGTGASGTWGISVTGNAATVTSITSSQVTAALGFTPYNATNPSGYTTNTGTVTSVSGAGTVSGLTLTGTVTSTGNLTLGGTLAVTPSNFASQTANTVLAAPNGSAGIPTFRALVAADIPTLTLENLPDAWVKRSVRVATTANITLSATQTIDGIAVVAGDRVLVKDQTAPAENGIYVVAAGAWARSADANLASEMGAAVVGVDSGTANGGFSFDTDFKSTDTLGTTAMTWARVMDTGLASSVNPAMNGTVAIGTSLSYARADHVHPVDTSRAAVGQTFFLGTTSIAINRASAAIALTGITSIDGSAATLTTGRTIALTGDVTYTSGSFNGSANVTGAATLANSGVTAGTYTKVTVDAKGRVTVGASLVSADLPTYTGTITSSQVTTGLGFTPYNASNPAGYITSSGNAAGLTDDSNWLKSRGSVAAASVDTAIANGYYTQNNAGDSQGLLVFNAGGSLGPLQMTFTYGGLFQFRGKTDSTTWTAWKTVLTSANYNSYAPTLTGTGASGTWGINVTGSAGSATTATTANALNTANNYQVNSIGVGAAASGVAGRINATTGVITPGTTGVSTGFNVVSGDITTYRSGGTSGAIYLSSSGSNYLYWDGSAYYLGGNQALHAGNYNSYALPLSGGTLSGVLSTTASVGASYGNARSLVTGFSGGNYGQTGYGIAYTTTSGVHNYSIADIVSMWEAYDGLRVYAAASGTVGTAITWTTVLDARRSNASLIFKGNTVLDGSNYSSYALPLSGGSVSYLGINNASAINLKGVGSGTYNTSWITSNTTETSWEAPITTDAVGGTKVPMVLTWRGGYATQGGLKLTGGASGELGGNVILHAANYNTYAPTKTGTGASGTWGISISGNAATATSATDSTKLPLTGGTLSGGLQVGYGGGDLTIRATSGNDLGDLVWANYAGTEIHRIWDAGSGLQYRNNGAGGSLLLHAGNYSSYALPLSGGTMTGVITANSGITVNNGSGSGCGINLYSGSPTSPTYGIFFATTVNFGTHGSVSADWATYFTMDSTANRGWVFRNTTSGNVASINNSGTAVFNGNVTAYSDERKKTNWRGFSSDFVEQLAKVKSGTYDRTDMTLTQDGVSAQSLQLVMPNSVATDTAGMLSVNYGGAALASAVELAKRVVNQEKRIAHLESLILKLIGD